MGNNAVDWMVAVSAADGREEAVEIGCEMLRQQIIQRISVKTWVDKKKKERYQNVFKDSTKGYYRFNEALIATYLLHINVVEASHLLGKQRNGSSSPFVSIASLRERCETRIISDSVNPVWNEKFTLAINNPESEHLVVRVWNWQEVAKNNFLGKVDIPVADVLRAEEILRLNAADDDDEQHDDNDDDSYGSLRSTHAATAGVDGQRGKGSRVFELPTQRGGKGGVNNGGGGGSPSGGDRSPSPNSRSLNEEGEVGDGGAGAGAGDGVGAGAGAGAGAGVGVGVGVGAGAGAGVGVGAGAGAGVGAGAGAGVGAGAGAAARCRSGCWGWGWGWGSPR